MDFTPTLIFYLGFIITCLASIAGVVVVVFQIKEAFTENQKWGIASIAGFLCLGCIPNLAWVVVDFKQRWEYLASAALCFSLSVMGIMMMGFEIGIFMAESI